MFVGISGKISAGQYQDNRPFGRPTYSGQQSYNDQLQRRNPNDQLRGWETWNPQSGDRLPIDPNGSGRFAPDVTAGVRVGPIDVPNGQQPFNGPPPQLIEASRIVARVGDHTILAGDLLPEINELIETQLPGLPERIKEQQREKLLTQLIPKAVEQKLMFADAAQQLPDASKLPEVLDSVRDQFYEIEMPRLLEKYNAESATELDARLRAYGGSLRRRRQQWTENQFIGFMIRQQIDIDPEVTHQELLDYYHDHIEDYAIPAKCRWQELMVRFDRFPNKETAFREMASIGDEVVFGASFEAVAQRRSQGFTAEEGGMRDWTTQGALRAEEIDRNLFELLPLNYLSDILESDQGFHIVRVLERQEATHVSFREAQVEIRETLKTQKQNAELENYMAEIQARIPVWTVLDDDRTDVSSR